MSRATFANGDLPDSDSEGSPIRIGRSHVAMWMRVVSSWVCLILYGWSLVAPVVLEGRFD